MVNVKELRVGNLIRGPKGIIRVTGLELRSTGNLIYYSAFEKRTAPVHECSLLPLTRDFLKMVMTYPPADDNVLAFGRPIGDSVSLGISHFAGENWRIEFEASGIDEGGPYEHHFPIFVNLHYIHQLQNLYFVLTGEDMEVKF